MCRCSLLVLALSGCHLLLPYDTSRAPDSDGVAVDAPSNDRLDQTATDGSNAERPTDGMSDAKAPSDSVKSDGPSSDLPALDGGPAGDIPSSYYVNEDFQSGFGAVTPCWGTWAPGSGTIDQNDVTAWVPYATTTVAATNYAAETRVTIHSYRNIPMVSYVGGALVARIKMPCVAEKPPRAYFCLVTPQWPGLFLGLCDTGGKCSTYGTQAFPASTSVPYRIQMTVNGDTITCALPDLNISLTTVATEYPTGPAGLASFFAQASFDYLKVWPVP